MKRLAICLATVTVLAACTNSASASDFTVFLHKAFGTNHHAYRHAEQQAHAQHHADLEHRAIERDYIARAAHQQPLTRYQDLRLHRQLDQAADQDGFEHEVAHATRAYSPRYSIPSYGGVPNGYGAQFRSSQYRPAPYGVTQFGFPQSEPYPYQNQVGCSPYGRY